MTSSGPSRSYSERYCQEFELAPKEFVTHVVRRSLHAPIRWVWPLAKIAKRYFEPDLACVSAIGNFRTKRELHEELVEFSYHPRNRGFWRGTFEQRISTQRIRRILRDLPE